MAKPKPVVIEYRSYDLSWQFPLLLLSGNQWRISDIPSNKLHFHNCLEIGICHSQSGSLTVFDKTIPFRAGDVTVIPKNVPHTTYSSPGMASLWSYIFFDPQIMFRNMLPVTWKNFDLSHYARPGMQVIFGQDKYPQIYQDVIRIIRELEEGKIDYQISVKGLLLSLYIKLTRLFPSAAENDIRENVKNASTERINPGSSSPNMQNRKTEQGNSLSIAPALNFIEQNYNQQFPINYLADLCHWSASHFRRVFHDIMQIPPLDFINHTRIFNACDLLQSTEDSILSISEAVGFQSISSFNRQFIKIMQMSPREYRNAMRIPDNEPNFQHIIGYPGWMEPETPNV